MKDDVAENNTFIKRMMRPKAIKPKICQIPPRLPPRLISSIWKIELNVDMLAYMTQELILKALGLICSKIRENVVFFFYQSGSNLIKFKENRLYIKNTSYISSNAVKIHCFYRTCETLHKKCLKFIKKILEAQNYYLKQAHIPSGYIC